MCTYNIRPVSVYAWHSRSRHISCNSCCNGCLVTWTVLYLTAGPRYIASARTTQETSLPTIPLLLRCLCHSGNQLSPDVYRDIPLVTAISAGSTVLVVSPHFVRTSKRTVLYGLASASFAIPSFANLAIWHYNCVSGNGSVVEFWTKETEYQKLFKTLPLGQKDCEGHTSFQAVLREGPKSWIHENVINEQSAVYSVFVRVRFCSIK
jgi:hypothetical protein